MEYSNAKIAIQLMNLGDNGPRISKKLKESCYVNDRKPRRGIFMDDSKRKIGRNALHNRLQCMKKVSFDWIGGIDKHALRVKLKKTFKPS